MAFMKYSTFAMLTCTCFASLVLSACGGDSGSSADSDLSSSSGPTEEEFNERCLDVFDISEDDSWESDLSGNEYLSEYVCDQITEYMGYQLAFYARCTSAEYDDSNKRYDIKVITEQRYMHIWAEITDCSFKLGTAGDMEPLIAKGREWTLDGCLCKIEGETAYYRNVIAESEEESSSSEDMPSSSEEMSSNSKKMSSSSENRSSSSKEMSISSDSNDENKSSSSKENSSSSISSSAEHPIIPTGTLIRKCNGCNAFKDKRDGNIYRVTEIGDYIWMAEDLRYKTPNFDVYIRCSANEDCNNDGYLYTFAAAMNESLCDSGNACESRIEYPHQGACPEGFHLPEHREWQDFISYLSSVNLYSSIAAALKAQYGWSGIGYDSYGFSAIPTGEFNGENFKDDNYARYWTSTEYDENSAWESYFGDYTSDVLSQTFRKDYSYAVRCIADGTIELTEKKDVPHSKSSSSSNEVSSSSSSLTSSSSSFAQCSSSFEINSADSEFNITTADGCDECNAFVDSRDNAAYRITVIGGVIWMADDLRYGGTETEPLSRAKCPDDDCEDSGRLYTYDAAMVACPEGWALPSNDQMSSLFNSNTQISLCDANGDWGTYARYCNNSTGFNGMPTGEWGDYGYKDDEYARYWTSTESTGSSQDAYMWYFKPNDLKNQTYKKNFGYAVRCIATDDVVLTTRK